MRTDRESQPAGDETAPLDIKIKHTDTEQEIVKKLSIATNEQLAAIYDRMQMNISSRIVQRDKKQEEFQSAKNNIGEKPSLGEAIELVAQEEDVTESQDEISLAFTVLGFLRKEMERRGMPVSPTMEERGL